MKFLSRTAIAALVLSATLALPLVALPQASAQMATPAIDAGGPRSDPVPVDAPPTAYGAVFLLLLIGVGVGVAAVVIIRRWDRQRPIERATEARHRDPDPRL